MAPQSPSSPGAEGLFDAACTILGGPNGSGKSSIFAALGLSGQFVNADVIARQIDPETPERVSLAAGRRVLLELDQLLAAKQDFVYETTLSSHQSIELMRRALDANYEVGLVFVALRDTNLNVRRVAQRVAEGGHAIPEHVIRRRYETSLERLVEGIRLAHGTMIFDNSNIAGPTLLIQIAKDTIEVNNLDEAHAFHVRVAEVVGDALGLDPGTVFRTAGPGFL